MTTLFGFLCFASIAACAFLLVTGIVRIAKKKPAKKRLILSGIALVLVFAFAAIGSSFYTEEDIAAMEQQQQEKAEKKRLDDQKKQEQEKLEQENKNPQSDDKAAMSSSDSKKEEIPKTPSTSAEKNLPQVDDTADDPSLHGRFFADYTFKLESDPCTSAAVDEIMQKAKDDCFTNGTYNESDLKAAIQKVKELDGRYFDSRSNMELLMYYGRIMEMSPDSAVSTIGTDVVQAVKYVYRGAETPDDAETKENLKQVAEGFAKLGAD